MTAVQLQNTTTTVFDSIVESLKAAAVYNRDDVEPPAAILWPDEKREWESLVPRLRMVLPQFLVLGPYNKANRTGPAIWLRCVLGRRIPEVDLPPDIVPIVYLPGVSRLSLRATEECPPELKPLAELQYRGVFWSQQNGKDWTVSAFLQTQRGGLDLDVARDKATAESIRRALEKLVDVSVAELRAKSATAPLDSNDFDALISDDPVDDLLTWLSDPKGTRERSNSSQWETLSSRCKNEYGFDPISDGELVGAELLGSQEKTAWKAAWKRFAAVPSRYPGLVELLRRAKPTTKSGDLFGSVRLESWPQDNEADEANLRKSLHDLTAMPLSEARSRIQDLEKQHAPRRQWVWAKLGRTPLAHAVQQLSGLAEESNTPLTGSSVGDMIQVYTNSGWRADAAVLDALAAVTTHEDRESVCAAIHHVYSPWLRDAAELFQRRVVASPLPGRESTRLGDVPEGTCVLFADGLRFDVGQKLKEMLEGRAKIVQLTSHTAALPSVTPTAKPAVSPVVHKITGLTAGEEFRPSVADVEKDLTPDRFLKLLEDEGFQILGSTEVGNAQGRAWAEYGNLDQTGHHEGIGLARRVRELLDGLVARIESLFAEGWREVRVVTDHGWLLVPGTMPKAELPKYLTATRWGRCAVIKETARVELPCFSWFWSDTVRVACPTGIDCFIAGYEYSHGGVSLQECVVPQLSVRGSAVAAPSAKIGQVKWAGLRCRVKIEGRATGCLGDLRDKANDPATSLTTAKPVGQDGMVSLVVQDVSREGTATLLVLVDQSGGVLDKMPVTVGE